MREFTIHEAMALAQLLNVGGVMPEQEAGALSSALNEIRNSASEIFDEYLPRLIEELEHKSDNAAETPYDVREACSHIHYQVKDCKLPADRDPWREIIPKD